jgi:LuxR family transcriptional regulator, maltose regulon positive regulatory protein
LAERYLRHLPSENRTDRSPGLELLVRALAGLGDWERAHTALSELSSIASLAATVSLQASASFASGCLAMANGDVDAARKSFEDALDLFVQSGAPFEVGRARIELAHALAKLGRKQGAIAEAGLALTLLSDLKAELEAARARRLLEALAAQQKNETGPASPTVKSHRLTKRELEVLGLVGEGLSNQRIAERLFLSDHTVHRHLANILNKLNVSTRAAAVAQAARRGLLS